jgi:hypothetical protein
MCFSLSPSVDLSTLEYLSLAIFKLVYKRDILVPTQRWGRVLNNFFDLTTPWLSRSVFHITASNRGCGYFTGLTMHFRTNVIKQKL